MVSGGETDVDALRINCTNGQLLVEQPVYGVSKTVVTGHWMEVRIRIPLDWKGAIDLVSTSGRINAKALTGSDITIGTVSGALSARGLQAITASLSTVNGSLSAESVFCERLDLRTVSGTTNVLACSALECRVNSVNSDWELDLIHPFERIDANTVTGNLRLEAPVNTVCAKYRTATGKLRTWGVSLQDAGLPVSMNTVSGDL